MPEKSNGKKNGSGTTLDLMGDDEAVKPRPARKPAAPVQAAETMPLETGGALFGGDDVDLDARHPADVPALGYPAPSQIAQVADSSDPFADGGEEDPFEDSVMARMLADEPAPLTSPLRAAREDLNEPVAEPDLEAFADPVAVPEVEQVVDFPKEPESAPEPEFIPEPATILEAETLEESEEMEIPMPVAEAPEAVPEMFAALLPEPQIAPVAGKKPASGLTFSRRYTQPGRDVWDTTEWEIRSASIVGSDGTVVFEQNGVEIPKSWSQLATNVVVSKYFRGQIGTLEREYSVKQLIGRVADKILEWAKLGAYFATEDDAETFHDELRYILLHQFAAFNSPVWFNLGWAGRRQAVSACLPYGVRVNTDRGLLPIGEIVRLFQSTDNPQISTYAPDGTPSRIVAAVCNGRKRVFNFHLADGSTLRCTSNHRVFVRAGKGEIVEKEAGQLVIGVDRLILNRSVLLPETAAQRLDSITPDADVAWLAGLMVGDGYCGRSKTLTSDTWDLKLNTLPEKERAEAILTKYGVPFRTHPKSWGFCLRGHGAVSRAFWSVLGLWGRVGDKQIPEWVYRTSAENVAAFLGGLFDSDGHVTENGNRRLPVFSNTSLPLMQATQTLLRSLGIYSSLTAYTDAREDYARKTSYSLGIHDNVSVEQFQEVIGFTHAHKQARMTERLTAAALSVRSADVLVVSKTQGGLEYVYDIQTESETFWAEGILLHNCYITEVDDSMESILDLYKTEGMLFKDGSGCTSGDSLVHVQDAGFLPIRNLYKKFFAEGRPVHEFDGKGRYIEVGDADIHTLSINPETGRFGRDQVLRVWQYDLPQEDKLTVRLDTGAKATVSCWHPFLVWDGEKITHRRADQLRRGDAVLGPNATARAAVSTQPTTFEYETSYFDHKESHVVTLGEDVAWLCGYFMGDGSLGARQNRVQTTSGRLCTYDGLRLRFYDETEETLRRVQQVIERVFGERVQIQQGRYCLMLSYTGRRVTRFFAQLFGVGSKTYSLSMPAFVWNSPRAVQLAFLGGLVDSDGYVAEGGRAKYSSASREFAGQVAALASFLGLGGGTVTDRHVETAEVLHRVATTAQRREFAAHLAHPERRRRLLETCSDKPQRKFCLPLSETIAHDLFGGDRAPADWLSMPVGDSTFHLGRLKYGGLINPFKLQKALAALGRDDDLTRLLTQVAESAAFVFSVEPCAEDPDFYDLTVRDHNNYLAGESGLVVIHNSGHNLSPLRSSKEPLSAGGRSSGPIAFMKGLDASAGSIKSGGSTRRAAKMVILNADHPDIQEFIDCKKDAELKAHALIDAGYSGAFNVSGGAYDTVPFQNANHSVRVTDEFMHAVEADGPWETKFRTDGKTAETLRARDLLHSIAEGTWVCGDPGMQYDTTANDWHTCANTDRIHASNPCCFVGETLIETAEGQIPFASLHARHEAGEALPSVFSFDRANRLPALRSIRKVWVAGHTQNLVEVKTERGLTFRCTPEHRFLTQGGAYVEARHLAAGTALCSLRCTAKDLPENQEALQATLAQTADVLLAVTPLTLDAPVPVYDMEVEDTHNFAITDAASAGLLSIVVSNSEFFFLNSTACNLSSLNLMKFRDAGSGAFDTESFEHAVQVMITAQEIVVGFAHYPTEKIEHRSHMFRPLGLGYANLGALLMADGLPYDSDAGRAYAGAVTALMTGRAYHQSAQIARDCGGPFAGFAENHDPMLRVMGKHRAAVDDINGALIPATLLDAARTAWDDALEEGQVSGYRNAQATVLAPTGCLVAGSLVITNKGVVRLDRLGDVNGAQWQDVGFDVLTDTGSQKATKFYVNGLDQTRRIETHCGYAVQGTPKHRVKVVDAATGQWDWKRFGEIAPGDVVALSLGQMLGNPQTVTLPPLGEEYWTGDYTTRVPSAMTPELAEIVGCFMGDGSMHAKGPRFCIANTDLDVAERVQQLVKSLFNLDAHLTAQQGYCEVAVHSVPLALWWDACGFSKLSPGAGHSGKGYLPCVPDAVLATNDPSVYGAFLRGLYEADGTVTGGVPCWSTVHRPFSEEVKTLLLALGLPTSTKQDTTGWSQAPLWVLRLRNTSYASRFTSAVGFMSARKAALVSQSDGVQTARHDYVYLAPEVIAALVPANSPLFNAVTLSQKRHNGAITRRAAESLYAATRDERVAQALRFFYDVVTANEDGGEQLTYDLSVPANVTYIAQGFVSHNTIGFLMDCDTTGIEPDIAIVKYKSLVGGGMMKIVNQTVPEALQRLGYDEAAATGIIKFIDENDTIEGAPGLKPEHLAIFDCAFRPMNGTRSIHYRGHLKMMAAAQPFISGAISKTCNMPNDATPDEIAQTYLEAWRLGIKAVAIYRDGSKRTQPLNMQSEKSAEASKAAAAEAAVPEAAPAQTLAAPAQTLTVPKAVRRRLPDERDGVTHKFSIGGHEGYLTVGLYPDTRQPGEIFIRMSKEGSSISGLMDSFATAISLALQYGVPLSTLVDKFIHSRFEPSGFTGNKEIPMAKSVMDYIFRYLALRFLQKEDRHNVGLIADQPADGDAYAAPPKLAAPTHDSKSGTLSSGVKSGNGNGSGHHPANAHLAETNTASVSDHEREIYRAQSDAPPCPECGAITIRSGACYKCLSCGTSLGCS